MYEINVLKWFYDENIQQGIFLYQWYDEILFVFKINTC